MLPPKIPSLSEWGPSQLDALGLLTIFGAKEMNTAVGNLVESSVIDWLPILGYGGGIDIDHDIHPVRSVLSRWKGTSKFRDLLMTTFKMFDHGL